MTGLLKNNFYGAIGSAKIILLFLFIDGITLLVTGNQTVLAALALSSATLLSLNTASSIRKESSTKWIKYQLTTPVKRSEIVKSRYLTHVLWSIAGLAIPFIFIALGLLIHGNIYFYNELRDPISFLSLNLGTSLFMGAIFYPLVYLLDSDKSEILMTIALLLSIALTVTIIKLINAKYPPNTILSNLAFFKDIGIYLATTILAFISSQFLTTFIYNKKEY